jgi:TPR repeat protein
MEIDYSGLIILSIVAVIFAVVWAIRHMLTHKPPFGREAFLEDLKKAQNGDVHAMVNVGMAYWRGDGVKQDVKEAEQWLSRAAQMGDQMAPRFLQRLKQNPNVPF